MKSGQQLGQYRLAGEQVSCRYRLYCRDIDPEIAKSDARRLFERREFALGRQSSRNGPAWNRFMRPLASRNFKSSPSLERCSSERPVNRKGCRCPAVAHIGGRISAAVRTVVERT